MDFIEKKLLEMQELNKTLTDEKTKLVQDMRINLHLARYQEEDRVVTSKEVEMELEKNPLPKPIRTNHQQIDEILGGFYPGQLVIIGAMPKSGKSEMVMDLVRKTKEHNPLLMPFEQNAEELISIMKERKREVPLFAVPRTNKYYTLQWISERITESVVKYGTKVAFIDHFGYIKKPNINAPYDMIIVEMLQELKNIAKTLNITIVMAVHTTKFSPTDMPTVEDLKGSAGFHQEADTIMMMWREAYREKKETKWTNNVLFSVQANRRKGTTGSFRMRFNDYQYEIDDSIVFHHEENSDNDFTF